ncbi:hypothetical protein [Pilimelia columellifera]|uniref:Uncharacterized protein n=1 Tax=Pilimelia columellifera subsp. columellifera TaxID=706583 RepID=A0ABN3MXS6_9ACTN
MNLTLTAAGRRCPVSDLLTIRPDHDVAGLLRLVHHTPNTGPDPVLTVLLRLTDWRTAIDAQTRALLAYARTVPNRPYRLTELAQATGMSFSGVRTAYGDHELATVATAIDL